MLVQIQTQAVKCHTFLEAQSHSRTNCHSFQIESLLYTLRSVNQIEGKR